MTPLSCSVFPSGSIPSLLFVHRVCHTRIYVLVLSPRLVCRCPRFPHTLIPPILSSLHSWWLVAGLLYGMHHSNGIVQ